MKKQPTMMIIDDLDIDQKLLSEIFKFDYKIILARNGAEAWEKLSTENFDIILTDLLMPEMDGFAFLKKIKDDLLYFEIPVVAMTARDDDSFQIKALELGASDYISKPYNPIIVKKRIENIVATSRANSYIESTQFDGMTGLYSRQSFCHKVSKLLKISQGVDYSIYHIDIENFKVFNEIYGNKFADSLLVALADKIDELVADKGVCGRLSADNFVAFLPTELYSPKAFEKMVSDFAAEELDNENVSIRLGIYHIKNINLPVYHMCDRASLAAQYAKEKSLKIANYNDDLRKMLIKEQEVTRDFEQALANCEFTFYLQAVYNITTTKIFSAEALARWVKDGKVIPPMNFIPILEKRGLIIKLDLYILEAVCQYLSTKLENGETIIPISVNLSRISLENENIFSNIKEIVEKYKIDKYYLRFEITESSYITDPAKIIEFVKAMRENDFKIYMDDFGSGYSSLNMLDELPVDVLKIDMKFIQNIEKSGRTGNIFASVARMAKWMNMRVIAEGAETLQQINFLKSIGCEFVQGYYFSKPITIDEFEKLLKDNLNSEEPVADNTAISDIDIEEVWNARSVQSILIDNMLCGIAIFETFQDNIELVRANDNFYKNIYFDVDEEKSLQSRNILNNISINDRTLFLNTIANAVKNRNITSCIVQMLTKDMELKNFKIEIKYLGKASINAIISCIFIDVTKEERERTECERTIAELKLQKMLLSNIMSHNTRTFIFEWNAENGEANCVDYSKSNARETFIKENFLGRIENAKSIQDDYIQGFKNSLNFAKQKPMTGAFDFLAVNPDNVLKWYRMIYSSAKNSNGKIDTVSGRIFDVSIHKQSYEDLAKDKPYINALALESLVVFQFALNQQIDLLPLYYSNEFSQNFLSVGEFKDLSSLSNICHAEELHRIERLTTTNLQKYFADGNLMKKKEVRLQNKNGEYVWCEIAFNKLSNFGNDGFGIGSIKVIEEKKELEQRAKFDYITKLLNRATFENQFEGKENAEEHKYAFFLIDVDNFKGINDKYGHLIGDKALSIISDIFREITKKTDLVGRLGGDEFVILVEYSDIEEVVAMARLINERSKEIGQILFNDKDIVTLSAGVALNNYEKLEFKKLYDKADKLLYEVKNSAKNNYKIE